MKSSVLVLLSLLLVTAILAPSIITLAKKGEITSIVIDFNEEKKEEKKETKEKDFFINFHESQLSRFHQKNASISRFYIESEYSTLIAIFLPPPEHNI